MRVVAITLFVLAFSAASAEARSVSIEFDAQFGLELVTKGLNATPVAPAKQDGLRFKLPVQKETEKAVRTRGGFDLDDPADGVSITVKRIVFERRGNQIAMTGFALIDGIGYDRFAFADGRLRSGGTEATLRLNGTAVAALNSQLQTTKFEDGQRIGELRL